ncbi:MAG: sucrase ferredoxin [Nitriliruptorales bacterium]
MAKVSCAREARSLGEPLFATASTVRRWILVEQPGPWGRDALRKSRLPEGVGASLAALGARLRARVLLLRRPGAELAASRTVLVGDCAPPDPWMVRFEVDDPAEVLHLDLDGLAAGRRVDGEPVTDPVYLVCTNGRHDRCCAEFGRPLAAAVWALRPDTTWECSHIGGDRFAGNLVAFPHGCYFGWVGPDQAAGVVAAYEDGRLDLDHYRGRAPYPFAVQAAEHFLRAHHGIDAIDGVRLLRRERPSDDRTSAVFAVGDDEVRVEVAVHRDPAGQHLTCAATEAAHPPRYELVSLTPSPAR